MKNSRLALQILFPVVILALAAYAAQAIIDSKELPEASQQERVLPVVQVFTTETHPVLLTVNALGTVEPRTESRLVSEVAGRIKWLSPTLASGGFFSEGELLLEIEAIDYVAVVEEATAAVARSEAALAREEADAQVAIADWEAIGEGREATPLVLHVPQLKEAHANLASAEARLQMSRRDVERTKVRAPYDGRVRSRTVDLGEYVTRGTGLAEVFAVDYAEIRLPISDDQLPLLELNIHGEFTSQDMGPEVALSAQFAGELRTWSGRIERIEGAIDSRTRSVILVARVDDPYGRQLEGAGPPLPAGLFVDAVISGRKIEDALSIPRSALRSGDVVYVLDDENRLELREIERLPAAGEQIVVSAGLRAGERVITSPLELPIEGMRLKTQDTDQ